MSDDEERAISEEAFRMVPDGYTHGEAIRIVSERRLRAERDALRRENRRLRHRVQLARSTVDLLRSYVNALHAGGIDDDLLAMMRGETERAITTWRALTEPSAAIDTDRPGAGEPT